MRTMPGSTRMAVLAGAFLLAGTLSSCAAKDGSAPDVATSASAVPGAAPQLGQASAGDVTVTGVSVRRSGDTLQVTGSIRNAGAADELESVASQVTRTLTLAPPLRVPASGMLQLGGDRPLALQENARLEPGGTVDLTLHFAAAGDVQVFASFSGT